jgi:YidC/Oxa1 family membrane protein insertase
LDLTAAWNALVVSPLAEGLRFLYSILGNYGWAVIAFTVLVRTVMLPLSLQQIKSSKAMQELAPQISAIQKKYGKDKEKINQETMKLYQEAGVNPLASCLPTLVQMPIWIGLYSALTILSSKPEFATGFLWVSNLAARPNTGDPLNNWTDFILPVVTVVSQWLTQKMMTPVTQDPQAQSMNSMMGIMPIMFGFFALQVPAGLVLYWVASNLFSMVQQYFATGLGSLGTMFGGKKPAAAVKPARPVKTIEVPAPAPAERQPSAVSQTPFTGKPSDYGVQTPATQSPLDNLRGLFGGQSAAQSPAAGGEGAGAPKTIQVLDSVTDTSPASEGKRKPKRSK